MDPAYARAYRELFERHWWWRSRERVVLAALAAEAPAGGFGEVLDIGCGDALMREALRPYGRILGLEPDASLVSPQRVERGEVVIAPFDARFDPDRRFGLIVMLDVLEHLDDAPAALRHVHQLLCPGGILLITVPAWRVLWTRHDLLNHHRTRYTRAHLRAVLEEAGLRVDTLRYFFHWLVPLKLMVRLVEWLVPGPARPARVPHPLLNRLFLALSKVEQQTWGQLP